jgi:NAD(P)-dependent dehydrogenase (short-subunit alcohol dehydrogenase family)
VSKPLEQCAVVITGGTSGVGLAAANAFGAADVTRLVLIGRTADANDPAAAVAAVDEARGLLDGLDVLVNSTTADYCPALLRDVPIEDIAAALTQQALAPMHMSRAALPVMSAQNFGVILNIASDAAKVPTPGETVIGAAMAAIVMFSRTLAMEAKRNGVRVNAITPSLVTDTETSRRVMSDGFSKKLFERVAELAHLGLTAPEDLSALIVFLAGPGAARITGQAISVNGGISAG